MKVCSKCKIEKSLDSFYKRKKYGVECGVSYICKSCSSIKSKKHQMSRNPNYKNHQSIVGLKAKDNYQKYRRAIHLRRLYKITLEQYDAMFESRKGLCDICHQQETHLLHNKVISLAVDHNHTNGKIRGLLCHDCNIAIGYFKDDVERIRSAARFLENNK